MDPRYCGQDVLRCIICDSAADMYCEICHVHLSKDCIEKHFSDNSTGHKVILLKQYLSTLNYPKCSIHSSKHCELHCEECDVPICTSCIASGQHLGHKAADIFERKKEILKRDLKELEESVLPKYQEAASLIPVQKDDLSKRSIELRIALVKQGDVLKREIDTVIRNMQSEIDVINSQNLLILDKKEDEITSIINEISQAIQDLKKLLDTNDVCLLDKYKSNNEKFRMSPPKVVVSIPNLQPQLIDREQLRKQFGSLSPLRTLLDVPCITDIPTENKSLRSISCLSDEQFWLCPYNNTMKLYNHNGKVRKSVRTKSGERLVDLAAKQNGDLFYVDANDRSINILSDSHIMPLVTLKGWIPRGVCCPSFGDLLVIMDSDDKKQARVARYLGSTETQNIQWDDKGNPLYAFGEIKYITENRNLDICVADSGASAVKVVNAAGKFRFRYSGPPSTNKESFYPRGIATDSQSRILVADNVKNRIHVLEQDGLFLRFIEDCGLHDPWGLCVDTRDNLFVTEKYSGKVKKIQCYN